MKRKSRRSRWGKKWAAASVLFLMVCGTAGLLSNEWPGEAFWRVNSLSAASGGMSQGVTVVAEPANLPGSSAAQLKLGEPAESVLPNAVQMPTSLPAQGLLVVPAASPATSSAASPVSPALPSSSPAAVVEDRRWIALTFDDGPDVKYTPQVLDILKDKDVKATFFLVGTQVKKFPDVTKRIAEEGHTIGNHSWSHQDLSRLKPDALDSQVKRTQDAISDATGAAPVLMRAPYGALSDGFLDYLHEQHLQHVYWTIDPRDWDGTSVADMRKNILKHARPGGIILLHSFGGRKNALDHTLKLLPLIIDDLRKEGYAFTTVNEMIDTEAVVASAIK